MGTNQEELARHIALSAAMKPYNKAAKTASMQLGDPER
jgi:hypothetical protein